MDGMGGLSRLRLCLHHFLPVVLGLKIRVTTRLPPSVGMKTEEFYPM
jgi:hypothetical protein